MNIYDVIVIGGGPSGVGAALQLKHNGLNLILIEKDDIGGRIRFARRVENLISDKPVSGGEVVKTLRKILQGKKVEIIQDEVIKIKSNRDLYLIRTQKNTYYTRFVVIATGLKPEFPRIRGLNRSMIGKNVFFDWKSLKRKIHSPVLIIGAGEVGVDSACSLKENGFEVYLFARSDKLNINPSLLADLKKLKINLITNVRYKSIWSEGGRIRLDYQIMSKKLSVYGNSILITIGGRPNIPSIERGIDKSGIYICGDAKRDNFHQSAIAFGDGVNTAMRITKLLQEKRYD